MFVGIGALHFNLDGPHPGAVRYRDPSLASLVKRIHRIGNHSSAKSQVIFGDRIADAITRIIDWTHGPGGAESLLD